MYKIIPAIGFLLLFNIVINAQKVSSKLVFEQGKTYSIAIASNTTIAQEAMGQTIDFNVTSNVTHSYKVTNATEELYTLHHEAQRMDFSFDGMGTKRKFNSDNKKDMDGEFGETIKKLLAQKYDVIIDPSGKAAMVTPEKFETSKTDDRLAIVLNMLKDFQEVGLPPAKGSSSYFKVLPDHEVGIGESWTEERKTDTEKSTTVSTLTAITDSTMVVDFKTTATIIQKTEMMGMEATTNMKSSTTGKIILDKTTGIIKEKTSTTESNGTTEVMGTAMPSTGKTTTTVLVKQL